jgi:hypothetical protein
MEAIGSTPTVIGSCTEGIEATMLAAKKLANARPLLDLVDDSIEALAGKMIILLRGGWRIGETVQPPIKGVGNSAETVIVGRQNGNGFCAAGPVRELGVGPASEA